MSFGYCILRVISRVAGSGLEGGGDFLVGRVCLYGGIGHSLIRVIFRWKEGDCDAASFGLFEGI